MNDKMEREIAEAYQEVYDVLIRLYQEACSAKSNQEIEALRARVWSAGRLTTISGDAYFPIGSAISALDGALGVKKITGGQGDRAYEKITDLKADANNILSNLRSANDSE